MLDKGLAKFGRLSPSGSNGIDFGRSQFSGRFLLQQLNQFEVSHLKIDVKGGVEKAVWLRVMSSPFEVGLKVVFGPSFPRSDSGMFIAVPFPRGIELPECEDSLLMPDEPGASEA